MQRYVVDTSLDGKVRLFGKGGEPFDLSPGGAYYDAPEVDAELAAKDARVDNLESALRRIDAIIDSPAAFNSDIQAVLRAALAASQHTAGSPPSPTGPVYEVPSDETFVILCDDQEEKPEFFQGPNAEAGARFRLATRSVSWHAHLFKRVATTARDSIGTAGSGDGVAGD